MEEATRAVPREKDNFRPDIEGLRGLAVLLVVFFHAGLLSNAPFQIPGGFIGVDLFFVVSGFLITGLLIRERERTGSISFSKFYARRVRRILPAAAVVLVVTILASGALVTLIARPETMTDGAAAALSIANVRFAITTDYFNPTSYSPFLHFWSLGVEEQFYLVWPALLFVVAWRRPRLGIGAALVSIIVVSFAANVYMTDSNPSWAFYMLPTRAWQLAGGGLLALFAGSTIKTPASFARLVSMALPIIGWTALMALLVGAFALNSNIAYPGVAAVLPTVAAMVLIASGGASRGPGMLLRRSPIRFLGKISYSLYLWHWPMLILGGLALSGATGQVSPTGEVQAMLTPVAALGLALASIPVATLSWAFIEEPFRRGTISLPIRHISFSLPRPSRTVVAGIGSMMLITVLCTSIGVSAQNSLDNLGSNTSQIDVADTSTPTDAPDPTDTLGTADAPPGDTTSDGTSDGTDPNASVINTIPDPTTDPTTDPTPTAVPAMTPALTNAPPVTPKSYAVTNALRPTLAHAANDFEATWHDGCLGNSTKSNIPAVGKCIYSNPGGTYSVVLIGDSHASALLPAVTGVAKAHGWKLTAYVKVDCKFVDISIYNEFLKRTYTECATWNAQIIKRLAANPPDLVIVAMSRWMDPSQSANNSVKAEGNAMAREIKRLPASSRVVMIQDYPDTWNKNVPNCLSNHLSNYRACTNSRSAAFASAMGQREAIATKATGAGLIDLTSSMCPNGGACPVVINGMIVFRDEHHLTATFSASLAPEVDRQLSAILAAWDNPPTPSPAPAANGKSTVK